MASAAKRATKLTTLTMGKVEVAVGLFATADKPGKLAEFTTAGPNGGVLKAEMRARAVPVLEVVDETPAVAVHSSDPFADAREAFVQSGIDAARQGKLSPETVQEAASVETKSEAEVITELKAVDVTPERAFMRDLPPVEQVDGEYGRVLVEDGSGELVAPEDVRKGIRLEDGRFIDCTDQLADIEEATKLEEMTIVSFVDVTRVPRSRVSAAYYLGAGDERAPKALRLMFEALKVTRRAAVVKVTKRSRQSLGVITATAGVLMLHELVWSEDYRPAPARALALQKASVTDAEVALAVDLVQVMSGAMNTLDELRDDAIALRELLHGQALAGEIPNVVVPKPAVEETDVMAMLEASLAGVA